MVESVYLERIEKLFAGSRLKKYPKNQLIHYQGDPMANVYHIEKGYIKAYTILDSGDTRTILLLSEGDIFPLAFSHSLDWDNYQIKYFYQTLTDCELEVLPSSELRKNMENDPEMLNTYMGYLSASNDIILTQLEVMKNKKAIDKVAMLIPYLIDKSGKKVKPDVYELQLKLSHQEIADISGVTRETTTTLIKELEKAGVIDQHQGKWLINKKNLDKLAHS